MSRVLDTVNQWRPVELSASDGTTLRVWERVMPPVPPFALKSVVFLYKDLESAERGDTAGGSGFLLDVTTPAGYTALHIVTNAHVVTEGLHVMRVNKVGGGVAAVQIPVDAWVLAHGTPDLAAAFLDIDATEIAKWDVQSLPFDYLYGENRAGYQAKLREMLVGIGDDVFMMGRFIGQAGAERNEPMARFGKIAMMPDGPSVRDGRQILVEAYLVEMHSLPGFSGSPVFLNIPPMSYRGNGGIWSAPKPFIQLLGVDTGHKYVHAKVKERVTGVLREDLIAETNSGIAIVTPAWHVEDLLMSEDFVEQRAAADARWHELNPDGGASNDVES